MKNKIKSQRAKLMENLISFFTKHQVLIVFTLFIYLICSNEAFMS